MREIRVDTAALGERRVSGLDAWLGLETMQVVRRLGLGCSYSTSFKGI